MGIRSTNRRMGIAAKSKCKDVVFMTSCILTDAVYISITHCGLHFISNFVVTLTNGRTLILLRTAAKMIIIIIIIYNVNTAI